MRLLYLLPSLNYNGAAKQALLLGRGLAKVCTLRLCVLHELGPWAAPLRAAGLSVENLNWTRPLDPRPLWRLRRLLRSFQPDRIHVWRLPALRSLALVGRSWLARCIASQVCPADRLQPRLSRWDRILLGRVGKIVAAGCAEAQQLHRLGIAAERITVVPPGVEVFPRDAEPAGPGRTIVCVGALEPKRGLREALRAADFLTYPFDDLQLHIIGAGTYLPLINRCHAALNHRNRMHLLGQRDDAAAWVARADVCWVPNLTPTGRQVALEAMAAGRAVVASDLPHLREIITDGVEGLLVPPGSEIALAQGTRRLLMDSALRRRLGESGRARAQAEFSARVFIERCRGLYQV